VTERFLAQHAGYRLAMNRCPGCGSLRVLLTLDGAHGFCTRCRRRIISDEVKPLFAPAAARRGRVPSEPDGHPHPAA
jgi:hypothetical protein